MSLGAVLWIPTQPYSWTDIQGRKLWRQIWPSFHLNICRYIPAAISIKHLLDHGKTANQLGSFLFLKAGNFETNLIRLFISMFVERNPHQTRKYDQGATTTSIWPQETKGMYTDSQWLHQQLSVLIYFYVSGVTYLYWLIFYSREVLDLKEEKGDDQLNNFTQILNNIRRRHLDTVIPYFLVSKNNINTLFPRCPKWQRRYSKCKQWTLLR